MRIVTGYFFIIILIPFFIMLLMFASSEAKSVQSFNEVLNENIKLEDANLSQTSYIIDANGVTISEIYKPMNRIYVSYGKMPDFIKKIFIVSEDQNFFEHPGFDLAAMGRAFAVNMQANGIEEGASTITQQLARNLYLTHEQSYNRKLSEILYAYQLEKTYSKNEIFELYLNTVFFQNGAYGIEAAANTYFQKGIGQLTNAEQAFLAAIPNNPTLYNPLKNFDKTKARQERLIDLMVDHSLISFEEAAKMKEEPITLSLKKRTDLYPDYVTYVENELKELISYSEGFYVQLQGAKPDRKNDIDKEMSSRVDELLASGIIIETALNPAVQERAVSSIKRYLPYEDIEGSVTVIDHHRAELIALVGGKNYEKHDFNRAFQAYRQPGSAIKPLLVYAPYINRTNAALTERVSAEQFCKNEYCPENYGGGTYGMVTLEKALIKSYNTPAVRILDKNGIENSFQDLSLFNFKRIVPDDYVLPAAIGGFSYGMTPLELTNAYTVFANEGNYKRARAIRQVTDLRGKVLYKWEEQPVEIWNQNTISKMRTLLNKVVTSGTGRKAYFDSPYIGGKTGTTNDYNDYWFIGLTDKVTAGVWVGKDTPANIKAIESSAPHQRIWKEIVEEIK